MKIPNWDDKFWEHINVNHDKEQAFIVSHTMKTRFYVCASMQTRLSLNGEILTRADDPGTAIGLYRV